MKKTVCRIFCLILAAALASGAHPALAFGDTGGHWAEEVIDTWAGYGVIDGSGGLFRPGDLITRAEMAAVLNRVVGHKTLDAAPFSDVYEGDWYYADVAALSSLGVIAGGADGAFRPGDPVTREEAAAFIARAFGVGESPRSAFTDFDEISSWAEGYVSEMNNLGYINGFPNEGRGFHFSPRAGITRAEVVKILDNVVSLLLREGGEYDLTEKTVDGNAVVSAPGVTIKNAKIDGDLFIFEGMDGEVALKNITVKGLTLIRGGAERIDFEDCTLSFVELAGTASPAINISGASTISKITAKGAAVITHGGAVVSYDPDDETVKIGGDIESVVVSRAGIFVNTGGVWCHMLTGGSADPRLELEPGATAVKVFIAVPVTIGGSGTISTLEVLDGITPVLEEGVTVTTAVIRADEAETPE